MPWPQTLDYNAAIQYPQQCFADPELANGQPADGMIPGIPLSFAGSFATVYKIQGPPASGPSNASRAGSRTSPSATRKSARTWAAAAAASPWTSSIWRRGSRSRASGIPW